MLQYIYSWEKLVSSFQMKLNKVVPLHVPLLMWKSFTYVNSEAQYQLLLFLLGRHVSVPNFEKGISEKLSAWGDLTLICVGFFRGLFWVGPI